MGAALLGMLPHALESAPINNVIPSVLFFALDKIMIWRHCHEKECDVHGIGTSGSLIPIGDAFLNLMDGLKSRQVSFLYSKDIILSQPTSCIFNAVR